MLEVKHTRNKWSRERAIRVQREMLPFIKGVVSPGPRLWSLNTSPHYKGPQGSSEIWLTPGLGQGKYKMSSGHLVAPES